MSAPQCTAVKRNGEPCQGRALPGETLCFAHSPTTRDQHRRVSRKGGHNRGTQARAARQWAAIGRAIAPDDLPAMLRAAMIAVWDGDLEPAQASALAALAKASVSITAEIELEARIAALEAAAGMADAPDTLRRIG